MRLLLQTLIAVATFTTAQAEECDFAELFPSCGAQLATTILANPSEVLSYSAQICDCIKTVSAEEVEKMTCTIGGGPIPLTPSGATALLCSTEPSTTKPPTTKPPTTKPPTTKPPTTKPPPTKPPTTKPPTTKPPTTKPPPTTPPTTKPPTTKPPTDRQCEPAQLRVFERFGRNCKSFLENIRQAQGHNFAVTACACLSVVPEDVLRNAKCELTPNLGLSVWEVYSKCKTDIEDFEAEAGPWTDMYSLPSVNTYINFLLRPMNEALSNVVISNNWDPWNIPFGDNTFDLGDPDLGLDLSLRVNDVKGLRNVRVQILRASELMFDDDMIKVEFKSGVFVPGLAVDASGSFAVDMDPIQISDDFTAVIAPRGMRAKVHGEMTIKYDYNEEDDSHSICLVSANVLDMDVDVLSTMLEIKTGNPKNQVYVDLARSMQDVDPIQSAVEGSFLNENMDSFMARVLNAYFADISESGFCATLEYKENEEDSLDDDEWMNDWWNKVGAEDYDYHTDDDFPTDDMDVGIEDDPDASIDDPDMSIDVDFDKDGDQDTIDITISGTTGTPPLFLVVMSTILVAVGNFLS